MRFPAWADHAKMTDAQRASSRLKFILNHLALHHTGRNSIRALAECIGYDHSTLSGYIRRGSVGEAAATEIVDTLKCSRTVKVSDLVNPLSIKAK